MIKILHEGESNSLNLSKMQEQKWKYIIKTKGVEYLLAAVSKAYKDADGKAFDRLLQNLFVSIVKDYEAGRRMSDARKAAADEYEVDPEDIPPK